MLGPSARLFLMHNLQAFYSEHNMLSNITFSEWWPGASLSPINEGQRPTTLGMIVSILTAKHVALIATGLFFLDILYNIFFHPLRHIPGPFLAKFSQTWRNHKYFRGTWHDDTLDLHRKHGNVVRIAPGEVSFVDEHGLKNLYGHGKQVFKVKPPSFQNRGSSDTWLMQH